MNLNDPFGNHMSESFGVLKFPFIVQESIFGELSRGTLFWFQDRLIVRLGTSVEVNLVVILYRILK